MSESSTCDEKDLLVSYLYGECDADDRARVERHVEACVACRDELAALRDVRSQLVAWAPPDGEVDLVVPAPGPPVAAAPVRRWRA